MSGNSATLDKVVKSLVDLNGSVAGIQQSLVDLKAYMDKKFADQAAQRKEDSDNADVRMGSIGNQVTYMRETMCTNLKETVSIQMNA